jgi:propanol-preferring alcohol dehydrogenase
MESYQIVDWAKPLEPRTEATPAPQGGEVLVKVDACGVCHSDLHIWEGYFDLGGGNRISMERGIELPFTLGHEIVGEVVAVGPEARDVAVGDKRIVYPWIGCGECAVCLADQELLCGRARALGVNVDGGYSDHVMVPHARYLVDYTGISTELAGTYACSGITAYSALKKAAAVSTTEDILIIGAGGVGLSAVHLASALTQGRVIVADVDPEKRAAAKAAGAFETVDNGSKEALKEIRGLTGGGVAAAIDFVGRPETAAFGFNAIRKGGSVIVVGLFGDSMPLSVAMLPLKMATLTGSYVGTLQDLKDVIALVQQGKVPAIPVETRPLSAANAALEDLKAGKVVGRVVLTP